LKATFDNAVNFINQFLNEKKSFGSSATKGNQVCNVSSTNTGQGNQGGGNHGRGNGGRGGRGGRGGCGGCGRGRGKGHRDITPMPNMERFRIAITHVKNGLL
jgi:hypothetical protein